MEYKSGSLLSTLRFNKIQWSDENISLQLDKTSLDIGLLCLVNGELCINQLKVGRTQGKVTLVTSSELNDSSTVNNQTNDSLISLPFLVSVNDLSMGELKLTITDVVELNWQALQTSGHFSNKLVIDTFVLDKFAVTLPEPSEENEQAFELADLKEWRFQPVKLAQLNIPIIADFSTFNVNDFTLFAGAQEQIHLTKIALNAHIVEDNISLAVDEITHDLATLSGQVRLYTDFSHSIALKLKSSDNSTRKYNASLTGDGSLEQVSLTLDVQGESELEVRLNSSLTDPQLPILLNASWENLNGLVDSPAGALTLSGDWQRYHLSGNARANYEEYRDMVINFDFKGNNQAVDIENLAVRAPFLESAMQGNLVFDNALNFSGTLELERLDPQRIWPELASDISGKAAFSGTYSESNIIVNMPDLNMSGTWLNQPLLINAAAHFDSLLGTKLNKFNLTASENVIQATGLIHSDQSVELKGLFNAPNLAALIPESSGRLYGDIKLSGFLHQPDIELVIAGEALSYRNMVLKKFDAQADMNWLNDKRLNFKANAIQLDVNQTEIIDLSLEIVGTPDKHNVTLISDGSINKLKTQFEGKISESSWQGHLKQGAITHYSNRFDLAADNVELLLDWQKNHYFLAPHCWREEDAELCVKRADYDGERIKVSVVGEKLPIFTIASHSQPTISKIHTESLLTFSLASDWSLKGLPQGKIEAHLTPAAWHFDSIDKGFALGQFNLSILSDGKGVKSALQMTSDEFGAITANASLNNDPLSQEIELKLYTKDFLLSPWASIVPEVNRLEGIINTNLVFEYANEKLKVNGSVDLSGGALSVVGLDSYIENLDQTILFNGGSATTNGEFNIGTGSGAIDGTFSWLPSMSGQIRLTGDNLEVNDHYRVRAKVSPDVTLNYQENQIDVKGNVVVPYARIKVNELPPSAITPSDDVVVVGQDKLHKNQSLNQTIAVNLLIDPDKTNEVKLDAFGLKTDLQGNLNLTSNQNVLLARGELNLVNGGYIAYGQNLQIQQGDLLFNGPMDSPSLIVDAIRDPALTDDNVIVGLRVRGVAQKPKVEIFSEPTLSDTQALSYLLRGQSLYNQGTESQDILLANMLIGIGLGQGENVISQFGKAVGVKDFNVGTKGQGEDTLVLVKGTIAPGVSVSYGTGVFDSSTQVSIKYQVLPKLYIETVSGLTNAIDVYYQLSIEGNSNKSVNKPQSN